MLSRVEKKSISTMCGSRKYPYPHHGGNCKFRRGGGSKAQEIPEGRGIGWSIWFPDALQFNMDLNINLAVQKSFLTN